MPRTLWGLACLYPQSHFHQWHPVSMTTVSMLLASNLCSGPLEFPLVPALLLGLSLHTVSRVSTRLPHQGRAPHRPLLLPLPGVGHSLGTTLYNSAVTKEVTQERQMAPSEEVWVVRRRQAPNSKEAPKIAQDSVLDAEALLLF